MRGFSVLERWLDLYMSLSGLMPSRQNTTALDCLSDILRLREIGAPGGLPIQTPLVGLHSPAGSAEGADMNI